MHPLERRKNANIDTRVKMQRLLPVVVFKVVTRIMLMDCIAKKKNTSLKSCHGIFAFYGMLYAHACLCYIHVYVLIIVVSVMC